MKRTKRRGVSLGTVTMLVITMLVLIGYAALLPTFTGNQDIRIDASKLAVAIDKSFSQLTASTEAWPRTDPLSPTLPPVLSTQAPKATSAPPTQPPKQTFSLCATGSIILNSTVQKALTIDGQLRFDILTDQLNNALQADLSIATLENTIVASAEPSNVNMPADVLRAIRSTGINALCIGHPGALNNGIAGLSETKQAIANAGMLPYGLYTSMQERQTGNLIHLNGIPTALLSYQNDLSNTSRKQTSENELAFCYSPIDLSMIASDITSMKNAGAKVIVVSLCWGKPGATSPTDDQRQLAQALADIGADIILGTHPGALQPVQVLSGNRGDGKYHPVLCAYSLGNLVTHDREKRANLASILLKANVVYDPATGCVAFDNLTYTPTYAWRGKDDGRTLYRILLNNNAPIPDFVDKDQQGVMSRCYTLVTEVMSDTSIPMN